MEYDPTKRMNYFDQQFLKANDFITEQKYHMDRRRRHNRTLHSWGIADGLTVVQSSATTVTVSDGTAYDQAGQEIVLDNDHEEALSKFPNGKSVYLTIAYGQKETAQSTEGGKKGNTRWLEEPEFALFETWENGAAPDKYREGMTLILAKVTHTDNQVDIDLAPRRRAGVVAGSDLQVRNLTFVGGETSNEWASMFWSKNKEISLKDNLHLRGNLEIDGAVAGARNRLIIRGNLSVEGEIAGTLAQKSVGTEQLRNGEVTFNKFKTERKFSRGRRLSRNKPIHVEVGDPFEIDSPQITVILVHAFAKEENAEFHWREYSKTFKSETDKIMAQRYVEFQLADESPDPITIRYDIFELLGA